MIRATKVEVLMRMAETIAMRSTCDRLNVGALIVNDGRIISSGYNGNVSGMPHCNHKVIESHNGIGFIPMGCTTAVHAEANAIVWAARTGGRTENTALFTTHQPCLDCAKLIINAGITQVWYKNPYRLREGLDLLTRCLVVFHVSEEYSVTQVTE